MVRQGSFIKIRNKLSSAEISLTSVSSAQLWLAQQSSVAEPQTHLYLPHRLVVDFTIDGPTTTTLSLSRLAQ